MCRIKSSKARLTTSIGLALLLGHAALLSVNNAGAQTCPPNACGTGVGVGLNIFFADGITPVGNTPLHPCETIVLSASLTWRNFDPACTPPAPDSAFFGGTIRIVKSLVPVPGGFNVTPPGGVPVVGDPAQVAPCPPAVQGIGSLKTNYVVTAADAAAGSISFLALYEGGTSMFPGATPGQTAGQSPGGVVVTNCPPPGPCQAVICDPAAQTIISQGPPLRFRMGQCVTRNLNPQTCSINPASASLCPGLTTNFTVTITPNDGLPPFVITWTKNGAPFDGNSATITATAPATGITDTYIAQVVSANQCTNSCSATLTGLPCLPQICIVKEVACTPASGICDGSIAYSDFARGVVGACFCYKITINNCGTQPLDTVSVTDPDLGSGALPGFPTTLAVGQSATAYFKKCNWGVGAHTNTATVRGTGGSPRTTVTTNDTAVVEVVPLSIICKVTLFSTFDMDNVLDNCVTIPEASPVHATVCVSNTSPTVRVEVTSITGLPCTLTPPAGLVLEPGQGLCVECDFDATCDNVNYTVRATAEARAGNGVECIYDSNGNVVQAAPTTCPACVQCQAPSACRVTGGGILYPGNVDHSCIDVATTIFPFEVNHLTVRKITHGGQLGAPFAHMDCGAILGNPCIRGQWSHIRHYEGSGNPRDVVDMDFHSTTPKGVYDSLFCACLGCCDPSTGAFISPSTGGKFKKFALCNPDDHKICGPQPRPSPANAIIWSGVGKIKPENDSGSNQKAAEWVVFRIYIEDRSEPGGNHPGGAVEPADIYCFQAWKTGIKVTKRPDFTTIWTDFRRALGEANCAFLHSLEGPTPAVPIGSLPSPTVNGVTADIQDCGPMLDGNHQIHPVTGADDNCVDPVQ